MSAHEITGIGTFSHFGDHLGEGDGRPRAREVERSARAGDRVELTAPEVAVLALLRQRVLVRTQESLELVDVPAHPRFHEAPHASADAFLGRLWGEQAQLASARDGEWPVARIDAAVHAATTLGVEDTFEMLCEQDRLDAGSWRLLCDVFDSWARKVRARGLSAELEG